MVIATVDERGNLPGNRGPEGPKTGPSYKRVPERALPPVFVRPKAKAGAAEPRPRPREPETRSTK